MPYDHFLKEGVNMANMKLYQKIYLTLDALRTSIDRNNKEWVEKHNDVLDLMDKLLPSGSGFDEGCKIVREAVRGKESFVIKAPYHHMDENGFYRGWTDYKIRVCPSFIGGFSVRVTGKNYNGAKEYITELFCSVLQEECDS